MLHIVMPVAVLTGLQAEGFAIAARRLRPGDEEVRGVQLVSFHPQLAVSVTLLRVYLHGGGSLKRCMLLSADRQGSDTAAFALVGARQRKMSAT